MKVLIVCPGLPFHRPASPELNVADRLADMGHDVVVFTLVRSEAGSLRAQGPCHESTGGIDLWRFDSCLYLAPLSPRLAFSRSPVAIGRFVKALIRENADVIHLNHPFELSIVASIAKWSRLFQSPMVFTSHSGNHAIGSASPIPKPGLHLRALLRGAGPARVMRTYLQSICFEESDRIIASTSYERKILTSQGVPASKVDVIPNGINVDDYGRSAIDFKSKHHIRGKFVLNIAQFIPVKGQEFLIRAIPAINRELSERPTFVFVGYNTYPVYLSYLQSLASRLNVSSQTIFAGSLPRSEVVSALTQADVFAFPSLAEAFPTVVLEAMASGKPIVATRIGPIEDMVLEGKNALLFHPKDFISLGDSLTTLLKDESLMSQMGNASAWRARMYSWEEVTRQLVQVYRQVAS